MAGPAPQHAVVWRGQAVHAALGSARHAADAAGVSGCVLSRARGQRLKHSHRAACITLRQLAHGSAGQAVWVGLRNLAGMAAASRACCVPRVATGLYIPQPTQALFLLQAS